MRPSARAAALLLIERAAAGDLRPAEVELFARAIEKAGRKVRLPPTPRSRGRDGWIETNYRPSTTPGVQNGPYVYWTRRINGRRVRKYLGHIDRARLPDDAPPEIARDLKALRAALHDD